MATTEEIVRRLQESRPPATDVATYLTIVEMSLSPEILPALQEILEDVSLTNDIGWDLVDMLIPIPGSEECLESIARLGNPREVILKVLEAMEKTTAAGEEEASEEEGEEEEEDEGGEEEEGEEKKREGDSANQATEGEARASRHFITLCGMLGILHKRLQVKAPSRFLHTTLETVQRCYDATSAASTAAVISLVQSLARKTRPPLPSRKSSIKLDTPFQDSDPTKQAPDPEADRTDTLNKDEPQLITSLLQSFITCIIEAYVNSNSIEWASRMLEYTYPERVVPGRKTMIQAFKEVVELQAKDALVGQLVSLAGDVGLSRLPPFKMKEYLEGPIYREPLSIDFDPQQPEQLHLSTGGLVCLNAYWMFAADVFDADRGLPDRELLPQYMLPDHQALLKSFLGNESQGQIATNPGTIEALVVMAIWLDGRKAMSDPKDTGAATELMPYHHLLTLVSVFHPNIRVRNAATVVAGSILHACPEEEDRLAILEDLLENCVFSSLQACAVAWLREELIAARKAGSKGRFSSPECFETIQYALFPDLSHLKQADAPALLESWTQSAPLHLQVANFALFLFGEEYKALAPAGMAAAIEHRYVEPLLHAARTLEKAASAKEVELDGESLMQLDILTDTLGRVPLQ
ncbi:yap-binding [Trichoderma cornu-damae]|uniref:Yap-binding n=1 Tax=Trichoderma cornu-damae TaxID=654480 RepID=A0A9P8QFQ5_9HYPO|nr:yap-binding [Trichoderma cornu-damae]